MSNLVLAKSSSPKSVKSLPQKLLQPTVIAILASIGVHGALAVLLPYMGNSSPQKPAPKTVELVKLTPAELSRIPQPATPPPALGTNQLPGLSTPYPPLPGLGSLSSLYPVNSPLNGLANAAPSTTPSTTTKTTATASGTDKKTKPQTDNKDTKVTTSSNLALSQGPIRIQSTNQREKFSSGGGLPNLNLTAADYAPATPPQPPTTLYPPAPTGNQTRSQSVAPRPASNPPQSSNRKPEPLPLVSPNIIGSNAANTPSAPTSQSQELTGINPATAAAPILPKPPLQPNATNNGTGTSYDQQLQEGLNKLVANARGSDDIKNHGTIAGSYPKDACTSKASGTSNIQAKIDEKGNFVSVDAAPASNPIFDTAAKQVVMNRDLEATNKTVVHMFKVEFNYDPGVCGSAATPKGTPNTAPPAPKK